jgi:enamine deaminase RidA (YjgF/YER057c/UK114 family)
MKGSNHDVPKSHQFTAAPYSCRFVSGQIARPVDDTADFQEIAPHDIENQIPAVQRHADAVAEGRAQRRGVGEIGQAAAMDA